GIEPILGRQIRPEEDAPGAAGVLLLSHGVWQRRYAGDASVIGRSVTVNGKPHTIIGVMPPRFQFPEQAQLWIAQPPIEFASPRTARHLQVLARMRPGVAFAEPRRDLVGVAAQCA